MVGVVLRWLPPIKCNVKLDTQYNKRDFNEAEKTFSYVAKTETGKQNEQK